MRPSLRYIVVFAIISTVPFFLVTGCTNVSANFPPQSAPSPYIPEEHIDWNGRSSPVVWEEPGELRGFLDLVQDFEERAAAFAQLAENTNSSVNHREAEEFAELADEDLAMAYVSVYFARGVERKLNTGDFTLAFADGGRIRDQGVIIGNPDNPRSRFRSTRDGVIILSGAAVDRGEFAFMWVLFDEAHLREELVTIEFDPDN